MATDERRRIAILSSGDHEARRTATPATSRFADLFEAFAASGVDAQLIVYHDDFSEEVRRQLERVDGVLVWVNPIADGRDRTVLDAMLRDVAATGVFVSAHPDIVLKLGTKEVVFRTRNLGWGCDTRLYESLEQLSRELPDRLAAGQARVLKRNRGNGGDGVWKVQLAPGVEIGVSSSRSGVRVRHAKRGCAEERIAFGEFVERLRPYFDANGKVLDQAYQSRLTEGMTRCYLVHDRVVGFGHQAINALFPAPDGAAPTDAPQPGPRLYHPPTVAEFQPLKGELEKVWVPALERLLHIDRERLPILWDCDFLLGPKRPDGSDSYVLCEINVSSVAPYPESAVPHIVTATLERVAALRRARGNAAESSTLTAIRRLLQHHGKTFQELHHAPTKTSEESARVRGESTTIGGKTLLMKVDRDFALFVISAARRMNSGAIRRALGARRMRFATAEELFELTGLLSGDVPPFGEPILPFPLFADDSVFANTRIAFNAGTLTDSIIMSVADWAEVAKPRRMRFSADP